MVVYKGVHLRLSLTWLVDEGGALEASQPGGALRAEKKVQARHPDEVTLSARQRHFGRVPRAAGGGAGLSST